MTCSVPLSLLPDFNFSGLSLYFDLFKYSGNDTCIECVFDLFKYSGNDTCIFNQL